jgi:hypothetical protein
MNIGRKIYYERTTGNIIQDTGERYGSVVETTPEQDFASYQALAERVPETVGLLQLEYGQYAADFAESTGYKVDVSGDVPELVFTYPNPGEEPPVYQPPVMEQLAAENKLLKAQNQALADRAEFIEDVIAEMAMMLYS